MTTLLASWEEPGKVAINAAWQRRQAGGSLLDAMEFGLATAELDPNLVAIGLGSVPNTDGELELDAGIMIGETLETGAVCALRGIVPTISVARLVLERTEHNMLSGDQARRFAIQNGFTPRNLMTEKAIEHYEEWRNDPERAWKYVHSVNDLGHDTITMLGLEGGKLIAASSTSGMPFKLPGRVGDSPIAGAGYYADDEIGAAGATGLGEELWKACVSVRAVDLMGQGLTPQEACDKIIRHMKRRHPNLTQHPSVVFAMNKAGDFGASVTSGEFPLWSCKDGEMQLHRFGVPA